MKLETLKRQSQFKRVRGGVRWAGPLFVMEGRRRADADHKMDGLVTPKGPRFGFTITRKVGGAVVRNRIRRRLKEAIRTLSSPLMRADHDYVVVASRVAHDYPFAGLQDALREAFERLHHPSVDGQRRVTQGKRPAGRREAARPAAKGVVELVQSAGAEVRPEQPAPDADDTRSGTAPGRR
jgi:ribonuclease P protein component